MYVRGELVRQSHSIPVSSIRSTRTEGVIVGFADLTNAAIPAAIGAAIDVPLHAPNRPPGIALTISSPGATARTHRSPPLSPAAIVEKTASRSRRVVAPTLSKL